MPKLMVQLTPPRNDDRSATMAPQDWLQQPALQASLKRNARQFDIDIERQKKLKFEPRDLESDQSILGYHNRTEPFHQDRNKICVTLDIDIIHDESREMRARLLTENNEIKGQITDLIAKDQKRDAQIEASIARDQKKDAQIEALMAKNQEKDTELDTVMTQLQVLDAEAAENAKVRMSMFMANMLVKGIEKFSKMRQDSLPQGVNKPDHSTNKYQQYASTKMPTGHKAEQDFNKVTGLDPSYYHTMRNLGNYQADRNDAAHETQYDFARLLLSDRYKNEFEGWYLPPLFEWVYDMTVEEAAKVKQNPKRPGQGEVRKEYLDQWLALGKGKLGNPEIAHRQKK